MNDFIDEWHARLAGALHDALVHLAAHDESPYADGVLHDWVRQLCTFQFEERDLPLIAAIIGKPDPHLQEAGVELATAALQHLDGAAVLEPALATMLRKVPVDDWVLHAVVGLMRRIRLIGVYREVVKLAPPTQSPVPFGRCIMRNRSINPYRELDEQLEQDALQTLVPGEDSLLYLPRLEARLGTKGWAATQRRILERMGLDPDEHLALLRRGR